MTKIAIMFFWLQALAILLLGAWIENQTMAWAGVVLVQLWYGIWLLNLRMK